MDILQELKNFNELSNIMCTNDLELKKYLVKNSCKNLINIMQLNIRSINKNFHEFTIFINELINDLDIIVLTETWKIYNISNFSVLISSNYFTYYCFFLIYG